MRFSSPLSFFLRPSSSMAWRRASCGCLRARERRYPEYSDPEYEFYTVLDQGRDSTEVAGLGPVPGIHEDREVYVAGASSGSLNPSLGLLTPYARLCNRSARLLW